MILKYKLPKTFSHGDWYQEYDATQKSDVSISQRGKKLNFSTTPYFYRHRVDNFKVSFSIFTMLSVKLGSVYIITLHYNNKSR